MGRAGRSFSDQRRKPEVLVPGKGIDFASDRQPDPFPGAPLSTATIPLEISSRNARVAAFQKRWDRLGASLELILDQQGADMVDIPGGASELLCRDYKGKKADRLTTRTDPGVISLVAELRGHERQAAEELERWQTRVEEPTPRDESPTAIISAMICTREHLEEMQRRALAMQLECPVGHSIAGGVVVDGKVHAADRARGDARAVGVFRTSGTLFCAINHHHVEQFHRPDDTFHHIVGLRLAGDDRCDRRPLRLEGLLEFAHAGTHVPLQHGCAFTQDIDPLPHTGDALVNHFDVLLNLFGVRHHALAERFGEVGSRLCRGQLGFHLRQSSAKLANRVAGCLLHIGYGLLVRLEKRSHASFKLLHFRAERSRHVLLASCRIGTGRAEGEELELQDDF